LVVALLSVFLVGLFVDFRDLFDALEREDILGMFQFDERVIPNLACGAALMLGMRNVLRILPDCYAAPVRLQRSSG
jgi:hypothetical protein